MKSYRIWMGWCLTFLSWVPNGRSAPNEGEVFETASQFTVFVEHVTRIPFYGSDAGYNTGAGFVIDRARGLIVTNRHVVPEGIGETKVEFKNKEKFDAETLYVDPKYDVAVLRIRPPLKHPLSKEAEFGDSDAVGQGHRVFTFGNPYGFSFSASEGIVSSTDRRDSDPKFKGEFFQTDASISKGNSGGPLIDLRTGKVIGINTFHWVDDKGAQVPGLGFALKTNLVLETLKRVRNGDVRPRVPWLGMETIEISRQRAEGNYGLPRGSNPRAEKFLVILAVISDSPAQKAGLQPGDLILRIEGEENVDSYGVLQSLLGRSVGKDARFELLRRNDSGFSKKDLPVRVEDLSSDRVTRCLTVSGMVVQPLTARFREDSNASSEGVLVVHIQRGSKAEMSDLTVNDVIVSVDGKPVETLDVLHKMLAEIPKNRKSVELFVRRYRKPQSNRLIEFEVEQPEILSVPEVVELGTPK